MRSVSLTAANAVAWSEADLDSLEHACPDGMSVHQIVDAFTRRGERLTEATFRKYVQLGLLPRSVRVGRKGQRRGSQGLYPTTAVRQIDGVRRLMAQGFTIEEIQREFLFIRTELDALGRQLARVFRALDAVVAERSQHGVVDPVAGRAVTDVKALADELVEKLSAIERRLSMKARMQRAAV